VSSLLKNESSPYNSNIRKFKEDSEHSHITLFLHENRTTYGE